MSYPSVSSEKERLIPKTGLNQHKIALNIPRKAREEDTRACGAIASALAALEGQVSDLKAVNLSLTRQSRKPTQKVLSAPQNSTG